MSHSILIAGVWHETNTFSPVATDLAAMIARYRGTNTEIGSDSQFPITRCSRWVRVNKPFTT